MKKSFLFIIIGILSISNVASAINFNNYPANIYAGKKAPINYNSHKYAKQFKTHINEAYNAKKPDFAGSYSVAMWGCGTACVDYAIIDRRNGKVYPLSDLTYNASRKGKLSCEDMSEYGGMNPEEFFYKSNSNLLVSQTICTTDEQGKSIYLNKYLLWNDASKKFSFVGEEFLSD